MLLQGLDIILVRTRFPENVGMAARACANMGCGGLRLVDPELWLPEKAAPLATPKGRPILDSLAIHPTLADAVAPSTLVLGTTARTGGWRRGILHPAAAAGEVAACLSRGERVAIVFGPEDRGLANEEIALCHRLTSIPTDEAGSLNVAQAVLLVLYECAEAMRRRFRQERAALPGEIRRAPHPGISAEDHERLIGAFRELLLSVDALHGDNPDYFLLPWRRFFGRIQLRRHEYDALMGLCRQVRNALPRREGEGGESGGTPDGRRGRRG